MKTIGEIKLEKEKAIDNLIKDCLMFFAFSNEQFQENKTPLNDGEKYVSVGMGGYMPKSKVEQYLQGIKEINIAYKKAIKENKQREANILYELNNHEAFYTGDITDTMETLGDNYTKTEVQKVFKAHNSN